MARTDTTPERALRSYGNFRVTSNGDAVLELCAHTSSGCLKFIGLCRTPLSF